MRQAYFSLLIVLLMLTACSRFRLGPADDTPLQAPTGFYRPTPRPTQEAVSVYLKLANSAIDTYADIAARPGDSLSLDLILKSILYREYIDPSYQGSNYQYVEELAVELRPVSIPAAAKIWLCQSFDARCEPQGPRAPFGDRYTLTLPIDWLGERTLYVGVQFRRASGAIVPYYDSRTDPRDEAPLFDTLELEYDILSEYDTRTPMDALPAPAARGSEEIASPARALALIQHWSRPRKAT